MITRKIHATRKNIFVLISFLLFSIGFTLLYVYNGPFDDAKEVEKTIERIHIKKGLYLFPRYEIDVVGEERSNDITKGQFESLSFGDTIHGYETSYGDFRTDLDKRYENIIGFVILLVLYSLTAMFTFGLMQNASFIKKNDKKLHMMQKLITGSTYIPLSLLFIIGAIFTAITFNNVFHKVNTFNQTKVEGIVLSGEYNKTGSGRRTQTDYELFIYYEDTEGNDYITKKAVTGETYGLYDVEDPIKIAYRNNNPHDIFIRTNKVNEVIGAFTHIYAIVIGLYLVAVGAFIVGFIKKYRRKKDKTIRNNHQHIEEEILK